MQPDERQQLIAQYADGYRVVAEALARVTPEELDAHPAPGKWSARQIVHHLADSEMTAAVRFRLLLAEDRPAIKGYDQDRFADRLHYERSHEASLELFRAARKISIGDAAWRISPPFMTTTVSAMVIASRWSWVTTMVVMPSFC